MRSFGSPCAWSPRASTSGVFGNGEVFAHYAPNLPEYAVAFHAVATLGGINTTANPLLTSEELARQLSDCEARLLVTVPERVAAAKVAADASGVEEIFVYGEAAGATPSRRCFGRVASPPRSRSNRPRISSRCRIPATPRVSQRA